MASKNQILLLELAELLAANRDKIALQNSVDVGTSLQTNTDNVERAIATLKSYAKLKAKGNVTGGAAIYSCYNDPTFSIFGLCLAPILLAGGSNTPILIGLPGMLKSYGALLSDLLVESKLLSNIQIIYGQKVFFSHVLSDSAYEHAVVFGDEWIFSMTQQFSDAKKSLTYYGPGNNAAVILPDADLELAVEKILDSAFILSGQAAVCLNRVIIDNRVSKTEIQEIFRRKLASISVGKDINYYVTPIKVQPLVGIIQQRIDSLEVSDAEIDNYSVESVEAGSLVTPTLVWLNTTKASVLNAYHFAPVLPLVFEDYNRIAALVNDTDYGIYASIWGSESEIIPLQEKLSEQHFLLLSNESILDAITLEKGFVGNWGGYKKSGFYLGKSTHWKPVPGGFELLETIQE